MGSICPIMLLLYTQSKSESTVPGYHKSGHKLYSEWCGIVS